MIQDQDPPSTRVLLTDGSIRRTLVAARALHQAGFTVISGENRSPNITSASRATTASFRYPDAARRPREFVDALLARLRRDPVDVLLPMAQETLDLVLARRDEFEDLTRLPFASNDLIMEFRDKARTMKLAETHGFRAPKTVWPQVSDPAQADLGELTFPVVVKPRTGWASRGVTIVERAENFAQAYRQVHSQSEYPIVQEFIPVRTKFHVNLLLGRRGELLAACAIEELRHHPPQTGSSTAQISVDRPDLIDLAVSFVRTVDWFGVASVDILVDDRDGTALIGEVNPRFWGSLNAAIAAGVNFPAMTAALAMDWLQQPVIGGEPGRMNRSLLPYDLLHLASTFGTGQRPLGFFDFGASSYDVVSWRDPAPTLAFFVDGARQLLDPEAWSQLAHMDRMGAFVGRITGNGGPDSQAIARETAPLFRSGATANKADMADIVEMADNADRVEVS